MTVRRARLKQSGVAAIEFVLVLPMLILMFVLMIDGFSMLYTYRKLAQTSDLVARLVGDEISPTSPGNLNDIFIAANLNLMPLDISNTTIVIRAYRRSGPFSIVRWIRSSKQPFPTTATAFTDATAPNCTTPPTTNLRPLLNSSDAVVVMVCSNFTPPQVSILTFPNLLGFAVRTFNLRSVQPMRRPGDLLCSSPSNPTAVPPVC